MQQFTRRVVLQMSAGAILRIPAMAAIYGAAGSRGLLDWDAFVAAVEAAARRGSHDRSWGEEKQEKYVEQAARLSKRLNWSDPRLLRLLGTGASRGSAIESLRKSVAVEFRLIDFEPGQMIPHHDHPSMTGVLVCANGRLRVDSYTEMSEDLRARRCVLRRSVSRSLYKGDVSTLTSSRDNIHEVAALARSQAIDIFAPPYDELRVSRARHYFLEDRPLVPGQELYVAYFSH